MAPRPGGSTVQKISREWLRHCRPRLVYKPSSTENDILTIPRAHFGKTLFGCNIFYILTTSPQSIVDGTFIPPALQRRALSNRREALEFRRVRVWGDLASPGNSPQNLPTLLLKFFDKLRDQSAHTGPLWGDCDPRSSPGWSRGARSNSLGRSSVQAHCQWGGVIMTPF